MLGWTLLLAAAAALVAGQAEIHASLQLCLQSEDLNSCLADLVEKLRPYMRTGLPDFNIPQTEPMFIPRVDFHLVKPPIDVSVTFEDNTVEGLSTFQLNTISADKTRKVLAMSITVPRLVSVGKYAMSGQAFVPLENSSGTYKTIFQDVVLNGESKLTVASNGKLEIEGNPTLDLDLGNMTVQFDNLFGGKTPQLSEVVHNFVNKEPKQFVQDFKPEILKQVSGLLKGFYTSAISGVDPALFGL
jgi:hypothetical protein